MKNKQKRLVKNISMILACIMCISNTLVVLGQDIISELKSHLVENFEGYQGIGAAPKGFNFYGDAQTVSGAVLDSTYGTSVNFNINTTKIGEVEGTFAKSFKPTINGQYIIDFDIKLMDSNATRYLEVKSDGKAITLGSINNGRLVIGDESKKIELDTWTRISFAIDSSNGVQTVYVNGNKEYENILLNNISTTVGIDLFRIRHKGTKKTADEVYTTYIDNMRVYEGNELKSMEDLGSTSTPEVPPTEPGVPPTGFKVYLVEDFVNYKGTGKVPSGFEITGGSAVKATTGAIQDKLYGTSVELKIEPIVEGEPDVGLAKRFGSEDIIGEIIVDLDIKVSNWEGSRFIEVQDSLKNGMTLAKISDGKLTVSGKSIPLEEDTWYRLSFALSLDKTNTTVTVYVDEKEVFKDLPINIKELTGINYLRVREKRNIDTALVEKKDFITHIDNMRVYTGTELKTMEELQNMNIPDSLMKVDNDLGISVVDRLAHSVAMVIGDKHALVNNVRQNITGGSTNKPRKIDGKIYVPIKFVGETLDKTVDIQGDKIVIDGIVSDMINTAETSTDVLVEMNEAASLLGKQAYTDYKGRGLVVIGDKSAPFDDTKDKVDEKVKPKDNEKFFIEEAIKEVVYDRPTGTEVIGKLKDTNKAHPRVLATQSDFNRVKGLIKSGEPTITKWYKDIEKQGEKHLVMALPTDDLPDGRRMISSRQVGPLVINLGMLYHLSDDESKKEQYKERIWAEVSTVAEFPGWNEENEFLNTAEFMEGLAIAYDWMYNEWTPEQRKILEDAMINKGLIKSLEAYNKNVWWMQTYPRANNWNAVCNGSTVLTLMAIGDIERNITLPSREVVSMNDFGSKLVDVALNALEDFILLEFTPDGAWAEGPSYWKYTLEYLVRFMSSLETALDTAYGYDQTPGISKTAYFPNYLSGPVGSLNYGDASSGKIKSAEVLWVARKYGDKVLNSVNLDNKVKYKFSGSELEMLWYEPTNYIEGQTLELDQYFSGTEVATFRSKWEDPNTSFLGLKAGNNVVSHGHYDLGSFVFEALGQQWAIDLGKDDYNLPGYSQYDGQRLEYYRLNPQGHNTLVINPELNNNRGQQQDIKAFSKIERYQSKPLGGFAIANLTDAYDEKDVVTANRGVMLTDNRTRATIQDEVKLNKPSTVYWFMHTEAEIEVSEDGKSAILSKGGEKLWVGLDSDVDARFTVMDAKPLPGTPNPAKQNQNVGIRKLAVELNDVEEFRLTVNMVPVVGDLQDINTNIPTVKLDEWNIPDGELIVPVLTAVNVDGEILDTFNPEVFSYNIDLPLDRTDVPALKVTYDEMLYTAEVVVAPEVPGITKVVVTSNTSPGIKSVYHFNFRLVPQGGEDVLLEELTIISVEASAEQTNPPNLKGHAIDGDFSTYWGAEGDQWIEFDLGEVKDLNSVAIAFIKGNERAFKFDIETSLDGENWYRAFSGISSGETLELEKTYVRKHPVKYVRIVGHGNSVNQWNSYAEVKLYTLPEQNTDKPVIGISDLNAFNFTNKNNVNVNVEAKGNSELADIKVYRESELVMAIDRLETLDKVPTTTGSAITLDMRRFADVEVTTGSAIEAEIPKLDRGKEKEFNINFDEEGFGDAVYSIVVQDTNNNESKVGFTVDRTTPSIIGIEDKGVYTDQVSVKVEDDNIYTITLNGETVNSEFVVNQIGTYVVVAEDKANNKQTVQFTIKKKIIIEDNDSSDGDTTNTPVAPKPEAPKKDEVKEIVINTSETVYLEKVTNVIENEAIQSENGIKIVIKDAGNSVESLEENQKVEVMMPYELKTNQHPEKVTIWRINEDGSITPVTNARYEDNQIMFKTNTSGNYFIAYVEKTFDDIEKYEWAKDSIEILASKGIINGLNEEQYGPSKKVTRGDFIKLLVATLDLTTTEDVTMFEDVKESDYYYKAIKVAKALGMAQGNNNEFNPKEAITREDMMVLTLRALQTQEIAAKEINSNTISTFKDSNKISNYAVQAVNTLVELELIQGDKNMINPTGVLTRAELAMFLYRLYNL